MSKATLTIPKDLRDTIKELAKTNNMTMTNYLNQVVALELSKYSRAKATDAFAVTKTGKAYIGDTIFNKVDMEVPLDILSFVYNPTLLGYDMVLSDGSVAYSRGGYAWQCVVMRKRATHE